MQHAIKSTFISFIFKAGVYLCAETGVQLATVYCNYLMCFEMLSLFVDVNFDYSVPI